MFGPRDIIQRNLVEVYWMMLHAKYHGSRPSSFREEDFFCFSLNILYKIMLTCDPRGGHILDPGA